MSKVTKQNKYYFKSENRKFRRIRNKAWTKYFVALQIYYLFLLALQIILFILMTAQFFYLFFVAPKISKKKSWPLTADPLIPP